MAPELMLAGILMAALVIYALGGGADFGGGVWDLLASGPRAASQRQTIERAIGPIWEANHVWLILVIVILFVAFPPAFAALGTALHIPLALMLIGIVLRGSAFAFRSYGAASDLETRRWGRVFAVASLVTPLTLGLSVGAVASGRLRIPNGRVVTDFVSEWLVPFPFALGAFTLSLFAFLAASYLTLETADRALQDDFRLRALGSGALTGLLAFLCLGLARQGAPLVFEGLTRRVWSWPFQIATGLTALGALVALAKRHFAWARTLAIAQTTLILLGWGLAQFPFLIPPDLTFAMAAAPRQVLMPVLLTLGLGTLILAPSLLYLFRVFKGRPIPSPGTQL
ncbi:MAG TPA: cytochrome d ubiquinol oxidase subunit II [Vicinamibacteria bacterium]|nr:cytochrome d ubiquinol oxidase subunit II [Vicinamibacteria bacterium]